MKTNLITLIITAALLCSCASFPTSVVNTGITIGVGTALRLGITDAAKRTTVANYIDVVATALRTVTGTPTAAQLTALIQGFIPASVKSNYPEILAFVEPIIIQNYQALLAKYGTNTAQVYAGLNSFAIDLEAACAPYISH
jgi:hypothetical protein